MQNRFESNILKKELFNKQHKLLLAISGGVDSVVLAYILKSGNFNFSLAHCNFKLRGKASDADEKFCRDFAKKNDLKIYVTHFNVKQYCKKNKVSVQMAARDLRYGWFEQLCEKNKYDFIITAHQANDIVETVFINLLRGTGINGMKGIPERNENIVRPLLQFTKQEIKEFATNKKIKFRLDKSNLEPKYERNYLRLKVIPELKKLNPSIESTFVKNSFRFYQEASIVNDYLKEKRKDLFSEKNGFILIDKNKLAKERFIETLLHFMLSPYGFNETQQQNIIANILENRTTGKAFFSENYRLAIERNELVITKNSTEKFNEIKIKSLSELKKYSLFKIAKETKFLIPKKNELYIEEHQLIFPLTVRTKQTGDKFKPFGMKGFKLLSDFFKDEKITAIERENVKLLVNGNDQIIWVIGFRSDERYKVNTSKKHFLKLTVIG